MDNKKLLILGCGWVGKITADLFLEKGFEVWGTITQESKISELKEKGIHPILLDLIKENEFGKDLINLQNQTFDLIIISIPVKRNEDPIQCFKKFEKLTELLSKLHYKQIVYLSSIGVYEPISGVITENSSVKKNGSIFLIQEYLTKQLPDLITLRLGGLFGFGRIPGRYFSNKTCAVGQEKANYVHGTDVASVIFEIWEKNIKPTVYNVVAPVHPLKKDIYETMSKKYNFLPVLYSKGSNLQKEVSSQKLIEALDYKFKMPSPLEF
jgi:nucleoside-diphosphate-sugar epimerase